MAKAKAAAAKPFGGHDDDEPQQTAQSRRKAVPGHVSARNDQLDEQAAARAEMAASRLMFRNRHDEMLMYELNINRRDGAPDPVNIILNEETFVIRRGNAVKVPWYVVAHLANNIETKYTPTKNEAGRLQMVPQDQLAENFTARALEPSDGPVPY